MLFQASVSKPGALWEDSSKKKKPLKSYLCSEQFKSDFFQRIVTEEYKTKTHAFHFHEIQNSYAQLMLFPMVLERFII